MSKRQLIMEKALELFAKQGIEATPIQHITDYCGISKGAFYLSFKSKDELIVALIDHFMMQFTSDIDYKVKNTKDIDLLYTFYFTTFESFHNQSDFAKIFVKEPMQSFNEELFLKVHYYDRIMEEIIISMIGRLYGEEVNTIKYDLCYCIKGFLKIYSELFLFYNVPLDLNVLSLSLVEKTNLLAKNMTIPFITQDLVQMFKQPMKEEITKEQILELIEQKLGEIEESIEKESLILLKKQLIHPTYSMAIVNGLIENIRHHPHCKWISYVLRKYYDF